MAADYVIKQGDTAPALRDTLSYSNGNPVDLTGCSVELVVRALTSAAPLELTGRVTIANPLGGELEYSPSAADTATPGLFMANWVVTYPDSSRMTFPSVGYISIAVEENLVTQGGQQLVSLPDVKEYLNVQADDRARDAKLMRYIEAARPVIEGIAGPIIPAVYSEWHAGGQYFIQVRRRPSTGYGTTPILTVESVDEYRGSTKYELELVADPAAGGLYSVTVDALGMITRRTAGGGVTPFPAMAGAVHISYTAGQQTVPHNVYEATLELLRVNYETTQGAGRGRLTQADSDDTGPPLGFFVPRRVREMLSPNRRAPSIA